MELGGVIFLGVVSVRPERGKVPMILGVPFPEGGRGDPVGVATAPATVGVLEPELLFPFLGITTG